MGIEKKSKKVELLGNHLIKYVSLPKKSLSETKIAIKNIKSMYAIMLSIISTALEYIIGGSDGCECPSCKTAKKSTLEMIERIKTQEDNLKFLRPRQKDVYLAIGIAMTISTDAKFHIENTYKHIAAAHQGYDAVASGKLTKPHQQAEQIDPKTLN